MPVRYRIDTRRHAVFSTAEGVVTDDELLANQRAVQEDPQFSPDLDLLFDARPVTELRATSDGIRLLALTSPFAAGSRRALVADSDEVFGMARMYESRSAGSPGETRSFRQIEEALDWLHLEE